MLLDSETACIDIPVVPGALTRRHVDFADTRSNGASHLVNDPRRAVATLLHGLGASAILVQAYARATLGDSREVWKRIDVDIAIITEQELLIETTEPQYLMIVVVA